MTFARTDDGVDLHDEVTGAGAPIVFIREFAATANTQLGVQLHRPSLYELRDAMARITLPTAS